MYALLSLGLLLSGCAATSPGGSRQTTMPGSESMGKGGEMAGVIFVVPLEGAPIRTGLVLADAIAAEIRDRNHPALLAYEPNQAGASVIGKVMTADTRGNVVWLGIEWAIRAPYGTHVATYEQHVVIDSGMWMRAAPEAINLLIEDAAPKLAEMVDAQVGPPTLSAMHRQDDTPPPAPVVLKQPDMAPSAAPQQLAQAPTAPAMAQAPAQTQAPIMQSLARISESTHGQVTHPDGSVAMPEPEMAATTPVSAPSSASPSAPAAAPPMAEPTGLPSLLQTKPAPVSATASPRALTPGAAASAAKAAETAQAKQAEDSTSFLEKILPGMDAKTRLPDDARPAGPGSAAFAKVRWGQPSFLIKPVKGASGNGNEALTAALKSALRDRDLTISDDPRQAGFIIEGLVDTGDPVNGRQFVRITWRVTAVTGEEVGKAVQENTIVAGSLNGEWGHVAEVVSNAAVKGIKDLFGEADERLTSREPLPEFPKVQLPKVPGRAPPPPASY